MTSKYRHMKSSFKWSSWSYWYIFSIKQNGKTRWGKVKI